ncbi:MAG: GTPase ObgE [Actinomycetota bacterium]
MLVDEARIFVAGGRGGDGAVSFRQEKYRPKGGPDGGSGGRGGSVTLVAEEGTGSLQWLRDHPHQRAVVGSPGRSNDRSGSQGADLTLSVPVGTAVFDEEDRLLADLAVPGDRFVAAGGGAGGRGNAAFLSDSRRAPRFRELGGPGEERWIRLELRLAADVAVIGYPNAGKSTLVRALSAARPKVADYPFTTLEPSLGVVEVGEERFTICDIPGIISGAHQGKGLGLKFLRHAQRAQLFLHLVDLASGRDCLDDYLSIREELTSFRADLAERREMVVLNKVDATSPEVIEEVSRQLQSRGVSPLAISAREGTALGELVERLAQEVTKARRARPAAEGFELFRTEAEAIAVEREGESWRIRGRAVQRWVAMCDLSNPEAVAYLQRRMERAGVEEALARAGGQEGDEVRIGSAVFEWRPVGSSPEGAGTRSARRNS